MSECPHYRSAVSGTMPGCGLYGPGARSCEDREHIEHCPLYARNADRRALAAESALVTERARADAEHAARVKAEGVVRRMMRVAVSDGIEALAAAAALGADEKGEADAR